MRIPEIIGARLRTVASVISRKPPASQSRTEHERRFFELQQREAEMHRIYERSTMIKTVRTYRQQLICEAVSPNRAGWICGHCRHGDLGEHPRVGEYCPKCSARVEEVTRTPNMLAGKAC